MRTTIKAAIAAACSFAMLASPLAAKAATPALPLSAFSFEEDDDELGFIWFGTRSDFLSSPAVKIVSGYTAVALLLLTIWGGNGRPVTP